MTATTSQTKDEKAADDAPLMFVGDRKSAQASDAGSVSAHTLDRLPRLPANGLAPSLERRRLQFYLVMVIGDLLILLGSFALISDVYAAAGLSHDMMLPAYLLLPIFLTIGLYSGIYSLPALGSWKIAARRMVAALLISAALLNFIAFFAKMNAEFSRVVFTIGLIICCLLMAAFRGFLVRQMRLTLGPSPINKLIIEAGGDPVSMPDVYRINAMAHGIKPAINDPEALDRMAHYLRNMDEVIVSCPPEDRAAWAEVLKGSGLHGEVVSSFAREIGAIGIIHHDAANVSTLLVSTGPLGAKRFINCCERIYYLQIKSASIICG